eukprot:CAMPEP_0117082566 /NCGR_PEP_ID=MMETSP0472-20121206/58146_1 /TAXON_ID=693140 ORGANISM="Tiarina fusus, Strain LIS" /NCGR_SAMPLE_ID=MMETSP0472 /ASSEMBLY_ACC=CAM_ASM_000603 /LENGTH=163 /DNA_ID=CAMNT_0004810863 /DNA_START=54 /DNA_END=546 /DNA_ORIENTATION=+
MNMGLARFGNMKLATTLLIFTLFKTTLSFTVSSRQRTSSPVQSSDRLLPLTASLQDEEDFDFARISRRRRRYYDEDDKVYEQTDGVFDDEEDDDDEEYDLFSNVLIDNPLLDHIDPDGAAERFPELASDPRFWIDMVLFISFLNYLSFVGPQSTDYFPDIPMM